MDSTEAFANDVADILLVAAQLQVEGHTAGTVDMAAEMMGFDLDGEEYMAAYHTCARLAAEGYPQEDGHLFFLEAGHRAVRAGRFAAFMSGGAGGGN